MPQTSPILWLVISLAIPTVCVFIMNNLSLNKMSLPSVGMTHNIQSSKWSF